ncbi:citrinin biosynthesis oxidoreductase protein [Penicillium chermesinum]|uniref:Citrinin biosynthesis oxidoreductase protein n=1 Tax=Penicillium chermesinum TaxID=63820 RepID=A0A9W9PI21_9EURO|nr:citrinin biosynthesis oxidoreductase protein [Penicillium chermesinum]KAJ5247218.1 citrinin biosynthesis oxidoreductase protein [Penicillium chermesinum]
MMKTYPAPRGPSIVPPAGPDTTLPLPRILCLHGGGSNARVFRMQCRVIIAHLRPYFRLVFAEGPWESPSGPDIDLVYGDWGPFKSWWRPAAGQPFGAAYELRDSLEAFQGAVGDALDEDDKLGGTGEYVGVLGFSQGANAAASVLLQQQNHNLFGTANGQATAQKVNYRFAVLMAGRGPPVDLRVGVPAEAKLALMTVHVHGVLDPGLERHRELLEEWCEGGDDEVGGVGGRSSVAI